MGLIVLHVKKVALRSALNEGVRSCQISIILRTYKLLKMIINFPVQVIEEAGVSTSTKEAGIDKFRSSSRRNDNSSKKERKDIRSGENI